MGRKPDRAVPLDEWLLNALAEERSRLYRSCRKEPTPGQQAALSVITTWITIVSRAQCWADYIDATAPADMAHVNRHAVLWDIAGPIAARFRHRRGYGDWV